jgi:hypothetical protein
MSIKEQIDKINQRITWNEKERTLTSNPDTALWHLHNILELKEILKSLVEKENK